MRVRASATRCACGGSRPCAAPLCLFGTDTPAVGIAPEGVEVPVPFSVWIIVKASRIPRRPTTSHAYSGPTARIAGVESGKVYDTREEAQRDAVRLAAWNRCGFVVVEVED